MFGVIRRMAVGFECMFVLIISLIRASAVCPIYALSQSGHVSFMRLSACTFLGSCVSALTVSE